MRRQQARNQRRAAAFSSAAREVDIPLPVRGIFEKARGAKVNGLFAAELLNLVSDGVKLRSRDGLSLSGDASTVTQRVPHAFGATPRLIEIRPNKTTCGEARTPRGFPNFAHAATISSNTILADGTDSPIRFDGTAFHICSFTSDSVNPTTLDGVIAHHDRPYLWQTGGDLAFWHGDVGAVGGALTRFPLDRLGNITGSLVALSSLTIDAGHGMNDILAIFTSTGQIVAFEGLDPTDANDWRLLGRVNAAAPISKRAFAQIGSDLWMLTARGIVSVGESLRSSTLALISDISQPVSDLLATRTAEGGEWQLAVADDASVFVINRVLDGVADQVTWTPESRAWATADMPVRDFHNMDGRLQGTALDGRLVSLARGGTDEVQTLRWTSSWFETGQEASVTYVKPTIRAKGPVTVTVRVLSDFQETAADIAEAIQVITMEPEEAGAVVVISDEIGCDATGSAFQITIEIEATWAEIVSLKAAIA